MRKYEFTDVTCGNLRQIRRISDGVIGGFLEKEDNLGHCGDSWVSDNAKVFGDARVWGNAQVYGDALVYGRARVYGDAQVLGSAQVFDSARVYGNARVYDSALVHGDAKVASLGDYISISGLEFPITWTKSNNSIAIGCSLMTVEEWERDQRRGLPQFSNIENLLVGMFNK